MNIENMRKLRTRMRSRKNPVKFNMNNWFEHNQNNRSVSPEEFIETVENHACGTVACLAGHAAILAIEEGGLEAIERSSDWIYQTARVYLELGSMEADDLFYGRWWKGYGVRLLRHIPKSLAVKELTRLIEKAEV